MRATTKTLRTPLTTSDVESLQCGDVIYISGILVTARDQAHKRIVQLLNEGKELPISLNGMPIYHAGPIVRPKDGTWEVLAVGPTTSSRMTYYVKDLVCRAGVKMIIGKGGMGSEALKVFRECKCVYCSYTGGAAVMAAACVRRLIDVEWLDLGIPEAMWILEVENFGPLLVTMDSHGNALYTNIEVYVRENMYRALEFFS